MTNASQLSRLILQELNLYANNLNEEVDKKAKKVLEDGAKILSRTSPKRTGAYAMNWSVKKEKHRWRLYNKDHYRLTHLLEKGYARSSGGRQPAQVHIKPVEEIVVKKFLESVEDAIRNGQ